MEMLIPNESNSSLSVNQLGITMLKLIMVLVQMLIHIRK